MGATSLQYLVILLCFSSLVCFNAIPVTRSRSLQLQKSQENDVFINTNLIKDLVENNLDAENIMMRRIEAEVNDYPGSGANNRHTPRPQRGTCADC